MSTDVYNFVYLTWQDHIIIYKQSQKDNLHNYVYPYSIRYCISNVLQGVFIGLHETDKLGFIIILLRFTCQGQARPGH